MDLLGMLYFIVEVFRTDDTFGDELSECRQREPVLTLVVAMTPPLPLVLFQMVASLKDRLPKGYPVKKVGRAKYVLLIPGPAPSLENSTGLSGRNEGSQQGQSAIARNGRSQARPER